MNTNKIYNVRVVGVTFDGRQAVCATLKPGEPINLFREPLNQYDSSAIKVLRQQTGEQIGYIDRYLAARLAPQLDELGGSVDTGKVLSAGRSFSGGPLGVQIQFSLPIPTQEYATE